MKSFDKFFPVSAFVRVKMVPSLLVSLAMYIIGAAVIHLVLGIFSFGGFLGFLFGLIRWIVNIYVTLGIIYSFLKFFDIPGNS